MLCVYSVSIMTNLKQRFLKMEDAQYIVDALGGMRKLKLFIGLKGAVAIKNGVELHFPLSNMSATRVNLVRITLNGRDLFDLQFGVLTKAGFKVKSIENGVYVESLKSVFEKGTGLYLSF